MSSVIVVGIDPGTARGGFAVLEVAPGVKRVLDLGSFVSDEDETMRARVDEYTADVVEVFDRWRPGIVVAESPNLPEGKIAAAMTWAAWGMLVGVCKARRIDLVVRTPGEWRKLLGLPRESAERVDPTGLDEKEYARARRRAAADARKRRKETTEELMRARWPGAIALIASTEDKHHDHAWDALAIATSWADKATETPTQGELAWQDR